MHFLNTWDIQIWIWTRKNSSFDGRKCKSKLYYINHIAYYTNNFDEIVEILIEFYSIKVKGEAPLDLNDVKSFFDLMIYGGGFSTWKKKFAEDKPLKGK